MPTPGGTEASRTRSRRSSPRTEAVLKRKAAPKRKNPGRSLSRAFALHFTTKAIQKTIRTTLSSPSKNYKKNYKNFKVGGGSPSLRCPPPISPRVQRGRSLGGRPIKSPQRNAQASSKNIKGPPLREAGRVRYNRFHCSGASGERQGSRDSRAGTPAVHLMR